MATVSGLSVKVSASTAAFRSKMGRAKEATQDLSLSLQRLSLSSERAESNIDEVGNSATRATPSMVAFAAGTEGAAFSVRGLSASIIVSLVPALFTLSAALVPIVAALGGFVSIAGAIAGIGLVGTLGAIAKFGDQLKVVLSRIQSVLMEELAPAFDAAASVLFIMMDAFLDIIPALVPAENVIQRLAGNFQQLGKELIQFLPALVDLATTLAMEFLPPFVTWVQDVLPKVPGFIQSLVGAFRRVLPMFMEAGRLLRRLAPRLLDFGFTALNVVAPALASLTQFTTDLLTEFNSLDQSTQNLLTKFALAAPIIVTVASALTSLSLPVVALIGLVGVLAAAWKKDLGNIRQIVGRFADRVRSLVGQRLPEIINSAKEAWATWKPVIVPVLEALTTALGTLAVQGLDSVLSFLDIILDVLSGDFKEAFNGYINLWKRSLNRVAELINKFTNGVLQGLVNGVISTLNAFGEKFEDFAEFAGFGDKFNFEKFAKVDIGTTPLQTGDQTQNRRQAAGGGPTQGAGQGPVDVSVEVKGDTGVVKDVATTVITDKERRTNRKQGRSADGL